MAVLRLALGVLILGACTGGTTVGGEATSTTAATTPTSTTAADEMAQSDPLLCANVIAVDISESADGTYDVAATVSSPDTGEEKYADQWRIVDASGTVLGVRVLTHPHVNEQPFTRTLAGVEIPDEVGSVTVEARDSVEGYCGSVLTVAVP